MRALSVLAVAVAVACRGDSLVQPSDRLAPTDPLLALTGAAGTQIFPTVPPGETQPRGDARGLNASGQVTGGAFRLPGDQNGSSEPYRWTPGGTAVRITGCCDSKVGNDINDAGTVVGNAQKDQLSGARGFVATGTTIVHLPLLPGGSSEQSSWAVAINNAGQIAGSSPATGFTEHATLWSPSLVPQDLGTLGGSNSHSIDLNASGQVIGWSQLPGDGSSSFFLWTTETGLVDLSTINPAITDVVEINDAGQIIGTYIAPNGQSRAFLYTPGSGLLDLGTLGGTSSAPTGLNNQGEVVGTSTLSDGTTHAFLWTAADGMEDITTLTGVTDVRRLNDKYQTLAGATSRPARGFNVTFTGRPSLVQLQVTQGNSAPTALFEWWCNGLRCYFDASGSLDDKGVVSYQWTWGKTPYNNGEGMTTNTPYPAPGPRTVTLTVTDAAGLSSTLSKTVTVTSEPLAALAVSCTGLTCTFDATGSSNASSSGALRWIYFGDGAFAYGVVTATHTYAQPGTYTAAFETWDGSGRARITKQVTVGAPPPPPNQAPVASFTWSCPQLRCSFDASGSTDDKGIVSYTWTWGKTPYNNGEGMATATSYPAPGPRTVTLTVTDAEGLTGTQTQTITVGSTQPPADAPPVASFTWSCPTLRCSFDASASTDDVGIVSYTWTWGKTPYNNGEGMTTSTPYPSSGPRTVTLTVTDTKGQTATSTQTIMVP